MSSCICSEIDSSAAKLRHWQVACWWFFWPEDWLYFFYIEAHSIHSLHQAVCRELPQHNDVEEEHLLRAFEYLYWKDDTEASQLCMQCRDSVSPDVWKLSQEWSKDSIHHAVSDERITKCMISTSENRPSWEYLMRVLHQLPF